MRITKPNKEDVRIPDFEEPHVSLFDNYFKTKPIGTIPITEFLFNPNYRIEVRYYRETKSAEVKKWMDCITPSGIFEKRCDRGLVKHSGLICIDVDDLCFQDVSEWTELKLNVADQFPSLYYMGLSISKEGVFLLFRIESPDHHKEHYTALCRELYPLFGDKIDMSCRNVSRTRIASFTSKPYYNPNPVPYSKMVREEMKASHAIRTEREMQLIDEKVQKLISIIREQKIDITDSYPDWFAVGQALASEYGAYGRFDFNLISRVSPKYDQTECDETYNKCLKCCSRTSIKTFFYVCKKFGVTFK